MTKNLNMAELEAGLAQVQDSPADGGAVQMIVARPADNERLVLAQGELTVADGLVGDNWQARGSKRMADGSAHPEMQLTLMNGRFLNMVAGNDRERWPLAGDQLIVDLDLGVDNLPVGQRLRLGTAVVEVTAVPHTGCHKFTDRFGMDAVKFANSEAGKALRLRGMYVKVVEPGLVQTGDTVSKI
ncbi:MAG: MOSC domain-containing protein [Anaerolineae bacterium]|nr:MOSC domain-containing protein [Anaerolineae bacterium]